MKILDFFFSYERRHVYTYIQKETYPKCMIDDVHLALHVDMHLCTPINIHTHTIDIYIYV